MNDQQNSNVIIQAEKRKQNKGCLIVFLIAFIVFALIMGYLGSSGKLKSEPNKKENEITNSQTIKSGKEYEDMVWQAFWEGASDFFKVEYSDYKMTHTACGFLNENETTNGQKSYYYLIQTAYETENIYGTKILHKVTARCYYVPETNTTYTTYITCDGETVYFNEEKENWLLGISG